ncbi:MAG: carbohydrate ABC transporter permease [Lachnospiraceae bacterium]
MKKDNKSSGEVIAAKKKKSFFKDMSYENKRVFWGIIFLIPWAIGFLAFFAIPLVTTFYYAFNEMQIMKNGGFSYTWVGIANFKNALTVNTEFNPALLEAIGEAIKNWPFQIFVSLFVAMLLNGDFKGRGFFRVVFIIPIILATGMTSIELSDVNVEEQAATSFINIGSIMQVVTASGIPISIINVIMEFVNDIFDVITTAGVQILIFLSGLQGISPSLYEVAKIEGCSAFESFCKITLPMISPMILVCTIYSLSDSFGMAEIAETINTTTFGGRYGLGASMSVIYFLVSTIIVLVITAIISGGVYYYDN